MAKLLAQKFFSIVITLYLLVTSSFFMLRALPGSPFDEGHVVDPVIIAKLEHKYGLDKPLHEQYFSYMSKLVTEGDLGPSLKYQNRDVRDVLWDAAPVSIILGLIALTLAICFGILIGAIAALYPSSRLGSMADTFSTLGISMPSFVFAGILISIFGLKLRWLPVALWEGPEYLILPALTIAIAPTAYIARITKSAMQEEINKAHVRSALAKGLSFYDVVIKHVLRNSLLPIVTVIGPLMAILVTGSFVVEYIYALPGMGKYFVTAFINRDYFLVSGVVIVFALILLVINTLTDLLIHYLNPKL